MLVKCKECGQKISSKADKCPHCGRKKPSGCITVFGYLLLILAIVAAWKTQQQLDNPTPQPSSAIKSTEQPHLSQQQIKDLRETVQGYVKTGVFLKIESASTTPHAFTGRNWTVINIDQKIIALGLILAYYKTADSTLTIVALYDGQTGKRLGYFDGSQINYY